MRRILLVLVGLVVLAAAAVAVVPRIVDLGPQLAGAIESATGRKVAFDGAVDLALIPAIELRTGGVRLLGQDGKAYATLGGIDARIGAFSLIGGSLVVERLVVTEPKLDLAVDAAGRANWAVPGEAAPAAKPAGRSGTAALPFGEIRLGEVRIERGSFTYADARTGQKLEAKNLEAKARLDSLDSALGIDLDVVLNGKPVAARLELATLRRMLTDAPFDLKLDLKSEPLTLAADGKIATAPLPTAAGRFNLDIPSVGRLAAWLGRPLAAGQPDPGKLVARARVATEGTALVIEEAALEGAALQATAGGRVDLGATPPTVRLQIQGGVLDVDRYLPPPAAAAAARPEPPREAASARRSGPLVELDERPLDVAFLRTLDAEVKLKLGGVRMRGFELGAVDFALTSRNGAVAAQLAEVALNGGRVGGTLRLDTSAASPALQIDAAVRGVNVGPFAERFGQKGTTGPVTLSVAMTSSGASPRALVENLRGEAVADLARLELAQVPPRTLGGLALKATLGGAKEKAVLAADFTYSGKKVAATATLDPLPKLLAGERFAVAAKVASEPLRLSFDGQVAALPAPSVDGALDLEVPSVAAFATWLGQPADAYKPDPGPLRLRANLAGEGAKTVLREATLEGKALKARLTGSADLAPARPRLEARLQLDQVDLDAYLPPDAAKPPAAAAAPRGGAPAAPAGWDAAPLDLSALALVDAKTEVAIGSVKYRGLVLEGGKLDANLAGGVLDVVLAGLRTAGGTVAANLKLDASDRAAKLAAGAKVAGVEGRSFLKAFADTDRISGKATMDFAVTATGRSQMELIATLDGRGAVKFLDGAIHGIDVAGTLRQAGALFLDPAAREQKKTDFAELSGTFTIDRGVVANNDLALLAPLLRVSGSGTVPLPPRTIDYKIDAKLIGSLEGQGRAQAPADPTARGIPIPIHVVGPWDKIAFNVDYGALAIDAVTNPFNVQKLPGQLLDVLRPGAAQPAPQPPGTPPPQTAPAQPAAPNPVDALRNLLGR